MYIPKERDIVSVSFDPAKGHEIQKRRPALVISNEKFNSLTGFCIVCPITSTHRRFGTYIEIAEPRKIQGDVVTHQLRSIDYKVRHIQFVEKCDVVTWANVMTTIQMFV
ncbi:type II toxin-antitoxin system PemK/MazF family toxin [Lentilactobacillus otakiensis]|jgi:mRNA interferase MazF|uniref:Uncharacterized protein n=1 Tax=Lentilactobacillus otakiensis DSM 19908 = JCM 15040 TaxID=1423780 RepID=S4PQX8_9LACO|nr:type II toxin-antitoxin system PemK/MazF family toxin [Lentilactobacillus otakiensis]KRL09933.1 hypothetical protein FD05_GL000920 [Lentilactobacillus otakiensis DSM 19908 = JCM 15040]MBZ3776295.1 type II toxin-antitoxin system PemK/MazF family toxin [Lentilactobacillus otakiensis]MDV3517281.1 type II toxin-antitoxin system PemK/MazF family toxin [Lentilactobacillus otakiensis]GAD17590.1 hypothetical protein LOT_2128 [Lentilactobacillus otakiensis DSM 19908 = JCM 15040]